MPKTKEITFPWGVPDSLFVVCVVRWFSNSSVYLDPSDGAFRSGPSTIYNPMEEVSPGTYRLSENRKVWRNGAFEVSIFLLDGGMAIPLADPLVMYISMDEEVSSLQIGVTDAIDVVNLAAAKLSDEGFDRYKSESLVDALNVAQHEIVKLKPDSTATTTAVALVDGSMQITPENTVVIIDILRNMGSDGNTPGRAISRIDKAVLDGANPDWHAQEAGETEFFVYDPVRQPALFYVYPPAALGAWVEMIYSLNPSMIDDLEPGTKIGVNDIYKAALVYFMCFWMFSNDTEEGSPAKADRYYNLFLQAIGMKDEGERRAKRTPTKEVAPEG